MQRKEGAYLSCLLLRQKKRKKNTKENINTKKGRSLSFFSRFYIWDEALLLPSPLQVPSMLNSPPSSSLVFCVSSKFYATQA
jgi:hypothetical protein